MSQAEKVQLFPSQYEKENAAASMSVTDMVCNCNGVTKGGIIEAVQKHDLTTVDEIKIARKLLVHAEDASPL